MNEIKKQNILKYIITSEEEGKRIKTILAGRLKFSRTLLRKLKKTENVLLNGKPSYLISRVQQGDVLEVIMDLPEEATVCPENIPLNILYENEDLMVIDKPAGLVVHPTKNYPHGTLANAVVYYWKRQGYERVFRPVQRLDKDTSGVIIIANNHFAHQHLSRQLKFGDLKRSYLAVVEGCVAEKEGIIDAPIGKDPEHSVKRMIHPQGQEAVTTYKVEKALQGATLLSLRLKTGRTHQIRVHMAHLGHPLLGDSMYGGDTTLIQRQALHSCSVKFFNPRTGKETCITSGLPRDMKVLIDKLSY